MRRYRKRKGRRRAVCLLLLSIILTVLADGARVPLLMYPSQKEALVANVFPMLAQEVSRGSREIERSKVITDSQEQTEPVAQRVLSCLVGSVFPAMGIISEEEADIIEEQAPVSPSEGTRAEGPKKASESLAKGTVILYHTHATESYRPVETGNFHSVDERGTVREVGDVLASALEARGMTVIHDKTLHDSPSYNRSYGRSLETATKWITKYPDAALVIDLHRDAAGYKGSRPNVATIGGEKAATYSLVIGTKNANAEALSRFAATIGKISEGCYPGLGGHIIKKPYQFNQYLSDRCLLLEIGNNENTIDEAKRTAGYIAEVLAKATEND